MLSKGNILRDIAWINTSKGMMTVENVLNNLNSVNLNQSVPGYEYGAQFRFLMTLAPALLKESRSLSKLTKSNVEAVLSMFDHSADLFDDNDPFMQLPKRLAQKPDDLTYGVAQVSKSVSKIDPGETSESRGQYWNLESNKLHDISLEKAVILLVSFYFYRSGGNSGLDGSKPKNGSSALRYVDAAKTPPAVEIIPAGSNLAETLEMSVPKDWVKSDLTIPHWSDREAKAFNGAELNNLWLFSWSTNTCFCIWDEKEGEIVLHSVGVGLGPKDWFPSQAFNFSKDDQWKEIDSLRKIRDPLYLYRMDQKGEMKMRYFSLFSDPMKYVSTWNADKCYVDLQTKWNSNFNFDEENVEDIVFLEHATGGTSQSFEIRHSKVVSGWKDEFMPTGDIQKISNIFGSVLSAKSVLTGMFTEKGTMKHLMSRQKDVEHYFWSESQGLVDGILSGKLKNSEALKEAKKVALKSLKYVSSNRNTVNLEQHLKAENILRGIK